ncbi:MAG: hypothetical protein KBA72_12770 [Thermoanaerobaculia bacterium]|nr:hypothetical protein [Thermoanaerobaculia bacterium]
MTAPATKTQLLEDFERLPADLQRTIGELTHALAVSRPRGVPARSLLKHAGVLDPDSARQMREAIEEGCEQVDPRDW